MKIKNADINFLISLTFRLFGLKTCKCVTLENYFLTVQIISALSKCSMELVSLASNSISWNKVVSPHHEACWQSTDKFLNAGCLVQDKEIKCNHLLVSFTIYKNRVRNFLILNKSTSNLEFYFFFFSHSRFLYFCIFLSSLKSMYFCTCYCNERVHSAETQTFSKYFCNEYIM